MTGLQVAVLAGMTIAAGLVLVVRTARPAPPSLQAALHQLSVRPVRTVVQAPSPRSGRWGVLPSRLADAVERHLGLPDSDLAIIGMTRNELAVRKLTLAAAGFVAPALLGVVLAVLTVPGAFAVPAVVGIGIAAVGWFLPSAEARERATTARVEFRSNLESFLTLVAGERRARGSVEQALEEAAAVSGSQPFLRMHQAIRRAALAGRKPWSDLSDLGDELDLAELRSLADIAAVASDGASVYKTLLSTARALRHAELSDARAAANEISERMARPLALLVTGLTFFVLVPFLIRMFTTAS